MESNPEMERLNPLLKRVSRSFYLTLRVLPSQIRRQIGLGYLLARTSDTIADTELLAAESRREALQVYLNRVLDNDRRPLRFEAMANSQSDPAEAELLRDAEAAVVLLKGFDDADRARIRGVITTIISGQQLDLSRFENAGCKRVKALESDEELEDYTYRVAGCVGEFWTSTCLAHLKPAFTGDSTALMEAGIRFGKGLQLVNILRDLPKDLGMGRCYLPKRELVEHGLKPEDLLDEANEQRLKPIFTAWHSRAQSYLESGWNYTCTLPREWTRVRLACAWPVLIGFDTLKLLEGGPNLNPARRPKISRSAVRGILWSTLLRLPFRTAWEQLGRRGHRDPQATRR